MIAPLRSDPHRPMAVLLLTMGMQSEAVANKIREIAPDIRCVERREDADPAEIDAILGWRIRPGYAASLPNLKLVCANAAGVEKLMTPDLPAQVPVTRIVDPLVNLGIAQHVATMALWHARDFGRYARQQAERAWTRFPVEVATQRVGILGVGAVGAGDVVEGGQGLDAQELGVVPVGQEEGGVVAALGEVAGQGVHGAGAHRDVGGQQAVQPLEQGLCGNARVHPDVRRLPERVHPGIRAPGADHRDGLLRHPADRLFELGLHGPIGCLSLPAAVRGTVVLEDQLEIRHAASAVTTAARP